jgi:hypothetical protein
VVTTIIAVGLFPTSAESQAPGTNAKTSIPVVAMLRPLKGEKWEFVVGIPEDLRHLFIQDGPAPQIVVGDQRLSLRNPLVDTSAKIVSGTVDCMPAVGDRVGLFDSSGREVRVLSPGIEDRELTDSLINGNEVQVIAKLSGQTRVIDGSTFQLVVLRYSRIEFPTNATWRICMVNGEELRSVSREDLPPGNWPRLTTSIHWMRLPKSGEIRILSATFPWSPSQDVARTLEIASHPLVMRGDEMPQERGVLQPTGRSGPDSATRWRVPEACSPALHHRTRTVAREGRAPLRYSANDSGLALFYPARSN